MATTSQVDYDLTVKVILLGDYTVNKNELLKQLQAMTTDGDVKCLSSRMGMVEMLFLRGDKRVKVKLHDTGGQERFRSITTSYYRGAHGCLLIFDVTDKPTFESLSDWQTELKTHLASENIVTYLTGINCDKSNRQVPKRSAEEFALLHKIPYQEVGTKFLEPVLELLKAMLDKIIVNASMSPALSITIRPLSQKMEDSKKQQGAGSMRTMCAC